MPLRCMQIQLRLCTRRVHLQELADGLQRWQIGFADALAVVVVPAGEADVEDVGRRRKRLQHLQRARRLHHGHDGGVLFVTLPLPCSMGSACPARTLVSLDASRLPMGECTRQMRPLSRSSTQRGWLL